MTVIRAYLTPGGHFEKSPNGLFTTTFGENVSDAGIDPNISLPTSVLYTGHLPTELVATIRHYSIHDNCTQIRKCGEYGYRDAKATVRLDSSGKGFRIEANGKTLANVAELCRLIVVGNIAPLIPNRDKQVESTVLGVKEACHRLIDSLALAFGQWRLRLGK